MNPDGTNRRSLPPELNRSGMLPINSESKLSWSPDGTRLAISIVETREGRAIVGESNIAILELSTGQITQITQMEGDEINPDWSPDGQRILFNTGQDRAGHSHVFVVGAEWPGAS